MNEYHKMPTQRKNIWIIEYTGLVLVIVMTEW